jgi:DNA-binding transcriptional ArsR family regulator
MICMTTSEDRLKLKSKLFRGFADSTRLSILECLRQGEKTVTDISNETNQSQSNISNHLACLLGCGLVKNRRDGKKIYYSLRDEKVQAILENGDRLLLEVAESVLKCTRYER